MAVAIFLVVLVVLILVHEFGHFIVAKKSGARVDEFGVGFPPKLFGVKKGETEYSVNALPFGGFVKIHGENYEEESMREPDNERSFMNLSKPKQAAIISAGVFFNLLLAWFLLSIGFISGLPMPIASAPAQATVENSRVTILAVDDGSVAEEAGLMPGDRIQSLSAHDGEILSPVTIPDVQEFISAHGGEEISLVYTTRGGEEASVSVVPSSEEEGKRAVIGVALDRIGTVKLAPHRAVIEAGVMTVVLTGAVVSALFNLITQALIGTADLSSIAGPVGIVALVGDAAELGFVYLIGFTAFISINLAVINLFPFPALDGGRLLFLAIEVLKGSPINPRIVSIAHTAGFAILILLILVITYNDIIRLLS